MNDIFGNRRNISCENITIFADERKNINNRWNYMGLVFIPTYNIQNAFNLLNKHRKAISYFNALKFSDLNKKGYGEKVDLAKAWLNEIIEDGKQGRNNFYFKLLGLDKTKINYSCFGNEKSEKGKYANIYNRFFRSALIGGLKYFFNFRNKELIIDSIFHDSEGNLENHEYFDWHCIKKIISDSTGIKINHDKIKINHDKIIFVKSDHNIEPKYPFYSQFIQLVDILIGSITYCIDYTNPRNNGQRIVSELILPLIDRQINNPYNKNSRFGYFRKYDIDFFPSNQLVENDIQFVDSKMYKRRTLELKRQTSMQINLKF